MKVSNRWDKRVTNALSSHEFPVIGKAEQINYQSLLPFLSLSLSLSLSISFKKKRRKKKRGKRKFFLYDLIIWEVFFYEQEEAVP